MHQTLLFCALLYLAQATLEPVDLLYYLNSYPVDSSMASAGEYWVGAKFATVTLDITPAGLGFVNATPEQLWEAYIRSSESSATSMCSYSISYGLPNGKIVRIRTGDFGYKHGSYEYTSQYQTTFPAWVRSTEVAAEATTLIYTFQNCFVSRYIPRWEFGTWNGAAYLLDLNHQSYADSGEDSVAAQFTTYYMDQVDVYDDDSSYIEAQIDSSIHDFTKGYWTNYLYINFATIFDKETRDLAVDTFVLENYWLSSTDEGGMVWIDLCSNATDSCNTRSYSSYVEVYGDYGEVYFSAPFTTFLDIGSEAKLVSYTNVTGVILSPDWDAFGFPYMRIWDKKGLVSSGSPFLMDISYNSYNYAAHASQSDTSSDIDWLADSSDDDESDSFVYYSGAGYPTWSLNVYQDPWTNPPFSAVINKDMSTLQSPWFMWTDFSLLGGASLMNYDLKIGSEAVVTSRRSFFLSNDWDNYGQYVPTQQIFQAILPTDLPTPFLMDVVNYPTFFPKNVSFGADINEITNQWHLQDLNFLAFLPLFEGVSDKCVNVTCGFGGECYTISYNYACVCPEFFSFNGTACEPACPSWTYFNGTDCVKGYGCREDSDCPIAGTVCDVTKGACIVPACWGRSCMDVNNSHCSNSGKYNAACTPCESNNDCMFFDTPVCNSGMCVAGCSMNGHCPAGTTCHNNTCVECITSAQCFSWNQSMPICVDNVCQKCTEDQQCVDNFVNVQACHMEFENGNQTIGVCVADSYDKGFQVAAITMGSIALFSVAVALGLGATAVLRATP